ncbi:MAG: cobalt ECF transporter T component CbiQ [Rhodospirillales bacterium]|nr:MAG: cobalt ECF transporter T component CbiQ [Rhodospirillales bacterium]
MPADAARPGPIADPRLRVVALVGLAFGFSALAEPWALALMVALTLALAWGFGLPPAALARRLRWPGTVVAAVVILLPLMSGETVLAHIGPLTVRAEGLEVATVIALRFLCIVAVAAALLSAVPLPRLVAALRALGLPALMADMALLMLRHVEDLRQGLRRMRVAMRLRGAPAGFWAGQFRANGWALASLLLRSHAQSERIYHAMIVRGHGAARASPEPFRASRRDWTVLIALLLAGSGLVLLEHVL